MRDKMPDVQFNNETDRNRRRIGKAKLAVTRENIAAARSRAKQKQQAEQARARLNLLIADLKDEGVDVSTPYGFNILMRVLVQTMAETERGSKLTDGDIFLSDKPEEPW